MGYSKLFNILYDECPDCKCALKFKPMERDRFDRHRAPRSTMDLDLGFPTSFLPEYCPKCRAVVEIMALAGSTEEKLVYHIYVSGHLPSAPPPEYRDREKY